ncbi:zinc ribbon domain-containing protein [Halorhabdus rudnickae]|uniref:zinc ribbon domain-containing protein n=1 Tax=Halorhabdus rudnickae TaxID=1775544 RepID=UPI00108330BA|nr:zinc ribbon domain-containing protein [Halorhabdus rudnickae]
MVECPACGAPVGEQHQFCRQCGASLGGEQPGGQQAPAHGQPGAGQSQSSQQGRPAQTPAEGGRQPPAQNARQGEAGSPHGSGTARPPRGGQGSELTRRKLLMYGGVGALALGGGGVLASNVLLGPDCSGPMGSVRCFFHALNKENTERAKELTHSEKRNQFDEMMQGNFQELIDMAMQMYGEEELQSDESGPSINSSIEELTLESGGGDGDETATVVADLSYEIPMVEQSGSYTATVDLRMEDGDWKVWAIDYQFDVFSGMGG